MKTRVRRGGSITGAPRVALPARTITRKCRVQLPPQEADPGGSGQFNGRRRGASWRAPTPRGRTSSSTTSSAASSRASNIPSCDKGFKSMLAKGGPRSSQRPSRNIRNHRDTTGRGGTPVDSSDAAFQEAAPAAPSVTRSPKGRPRVILEAHHAGRLRRAGAKYQGGNDRPPCSSAAASSCRRPRDDSGFSKVEAEVPASPRWFGFSTAAPLPPRKGKGRVPDGVLGAYAQVPSSIAAGAHQEAPRRREEKKKKVTLRQARGGVARPVAWVLLFLPPCPPPTSRQVALREGGFCHFGRPGGNITSDRRDVLRPRARPAPPWCRIRCVKTEARAPVRGTTILLVRGIRTRWRRPSEGFVQIHQ